MVLYFAYGSNLSLGQMKKRLGRKIVPSKVVFMTDSVLWFPRYSPKREGGVASFNESQNEKLWGALFDLTESDLNELDRAEGVPYCYKRKEIDVFDETGKKYVALTYEAIRKGEFFPSKAYMQTIIFGAKECELPQDYIQKLKNIKTIYA